MGLRPSFVSTCQKVQPLQLGAACSLAPSPWIEPVCPSHSSEPSARTMAFQRRFISYSIVPGLSRPVSINPQLLENRPFDEIAVGDTASITRVLNKDDIVQWQRRLDSL